MYRNLRRNTALVGMHGILTSYRLGIPYWRCPCRVQVMYLRTNRATNRVQLDIPCG